MRSLLFALGNAIPFCSPCGWQSAALNILLAALSVRRGGMLSLLFALGNAISFDCPVVGGLPP